jgi:nitrogen fixation NifU-like protein
MYSPQVSDHIANPRNVGELENPSGVGDVTNEVCLDRSVLTELIIGRSISDLQQITKLEVIQALGHLPPAKSHCASLAVEALREAISGMGK